MNLPTRLSRAVLRLRWSLVTALAPRRIVESRGLRFTLQCENWITHYRWESYNEKEPETLDWIDQLVRDGDCVFDVGANIGVYSLYLALRHPNVRVLAFEAEYSNLHLFRDNVVANGLGDRIEIYSVAPSDRSGLSHLHIGDLTPGAALHSESDQQLRSTKTGRPVMFREGIAAMTLDRFCDEAALQPNAIKIDVDGTELEILQGAARSLGSPELRTVIVEMSQGRREQCATLLTQAGLRRATSGALSSPSENEVWVR